MDDDAGHSIGESSPRLYRSREPGAGSREPGAGSRDCVRGPGGALRPHRSPHLPALSDVEPIGVLLITNEVEEVFFLLEKLTRELNLAVESDEHVPHP